MSEEHEGEQADQSILDSFEGDPLSSSVMMDGKLVFIHIYPDGTIVPSEETTPVEAEAIVAKAKEAMGLTKKSKKLEAFDRIVKK